MKIFIAFYTAVITALMLSVGAMAASVNPVTGDNSIVGPMIIVAAVALVAIVIFFATGKKKK